MAASAEEGLDDSQGGRFFPDGWSRYWTEHSERSKLASGLAAMGVHKSERDMLGRWVTTYNSVVGKMQSSFATMVRRGNAYKNLDEGGIIEGIRIWLIGPWAVEVDSANRAVDAWKSKLEKVGFITMVNMDWVESPQRTPEFAQESEGREEREEQGHVTPEEFETSEGDQEQQQEGAEKVHTSLSTGVQEEARYTDWTPRDAGWLADVNS